MILYTIMAARAAAATVSVIILIKMERIFMRIKILGLEK